ncbi:EpsG family protein [Aeromonas sp. 3P]|uniref:EpsG family protein n=1 Tax=Aeromonas sp. 3P TaxID=3452719 RepID=UPI003F7A2849
MGSYIAYIFPYIILSLFTFRHNGILRGKFPWILFYVFLCLFIGLRESIGGDWLLYNKFFIEISKLSFFDAIRYTDPAYAAINWIVGRTFGTIYIVNFICALIFFSCIFIFCSKQPYPWLCLAVLYPYLIVVVGMGYTRQSVAIGLSLLAVSFFLDGKVYKSLLVIMLSVLFHKSSLSFIPVFILGLNNKKIIFSMLLFFIAMMIYIYLFYWNHISELYIKNLVYSQGAILRVGLGIFILCLYLMVNPSPSFFFVCG